MKMITFVVWLAALTMVLTKPSQKTIEGLQSGLYEFKQMDQNQSQLFMWKFSTPFSKTPQLAFAINSLVISNQVSSNNIELIPKAVTSTGVIISWKRESHHWIYLSINYMTSTREDLTLGHTQISLPDKNQVNYDILFDPPVKNQQTSIARMFLTGCSADSKIFDCKITGKSFTPTALTLVGFVGGNNITNGKLSLSYIIFSPSTVSFSSSGGMFEKENFAGKYSSDVRKVIYKTDNFLYGFSILKFGAQNGQRLSVDIDKDEVMTIQAQKQVSFRLIYIALGLSSKESCSDPAVPYEWQDQCVASCPSNSYAYTYANGGHACISCSDKLNLILRSGECVCKDAYIMEQKQCVPQHVSMATVQVKEIEPPKSQPLQKLNEKEIELMKLLKKMQERSGSLKISMQQQSNKPSGFIVGKLGKKETQQQEQNSSEQQQGCNCNQVHSYKSMSTNKPIIIQSIPNPVLDLSSPIVRHPQPPPSVQPVFSQSPNNNPQVAPQYIESSPKGTQSCACLNSPLNSYKSNQTVSLPQVFDSPCPDSPNIPINCGPHGFLLDGVCFCKPGFKKVNGNCVSSDECTYVLPVYDEPSCEILGIPEVPECPIPQYPNQTSCPSTPPPTCNSCNGPKKCPPPSFLGCDGQCHCPLDYVMYNGQCFHCPYPGVFDPNTGKCEVICGDNADYSDCQGRCVCRQGYGIGPDGKCQRCNKINAFLKDGYCVTCSDDKIYDSVKKTCVCPEGRLLDNNGKCTSRCGQNEVFNLETQSCKCRSGFGRLQTYCVLCPSGYFIDSSGNCDVCAFNKELVNGSCVCKRGFVEIEGACVNCQNRSGYYVRSGNCLSCPIGYTLSGTRCIQQIGQATRSIQVVPTPSQQVNNNAPVPDKAIIQSSPKAVCGNGLIQNGQECDDKNTFNGDGCSSVCKIEPGYSCVRMPSQCTKSSVNSGTVSNTPTAPATTAPTVTSASSSGIITNQNLVLNGQVVGNTNQIFLTLETPQPIDFPSEDAMKNFLQVKFENCPPPTVYCSQKPPPNKQLFDCLMLFPSGVPNTSFKAIFSYDYQGKTGFNNLAIDPLTLTSSNPRNRRTNSRSAFNQRMT